MFRIRFHGRGGQGIKTASQILGTAFFRAGFEVQDAPRYGAERRGAPIFAYVRAAQAPIHERGVIARPDLVVVADETLVPVPAAGVLAGLGEESVLLLNSDVPAEIWRERLKRNVRVIPLPVDRDIRDRAAMRFTGATGAGAAARLVGAIPRETLAAAIREELAARGDETVAVNLEHALGAYDALAAHEGIVGEGGSRPASDYVRPEWITLPLEDASLAAPSVHAQATTVEVRTGLWRTMRPVIDYGHCNRCSWICGTLCPDSAIRVEPDHRPVIDYDHCKGCLVCAAVCPPHAIHAVPEREAQEAL